MTTRLIDFQNLIFRCMPERTFSDMGIKKKEMIRLSHSMRSLDFTPGLSKVTCPVTILCGEKDKGNRKAAKRLHELLPQSELRIIPGAGHEMNKSPDAKRNAELLGLMVNDPNIEPKELAGIKAPTLVICEDRDMVKESHTKEV